MKERDEKLSVSEGNILNTSLPCLFAEEKTDTTGVCFTLHDIRVCGIPVCTEDMFILLGSITNLFNILRMLGVLCTLQAGSL